MVSLEKFTRPHYVEGRFDWLAQGFVPGGLPGEVTANEGDPKGLKRVRVRCPLIEENSDLPIGDDGWVEVGELFTLNATSGGSHRPLPVGTQVVMLPILGDPRRLIILHAVPNAVDPPSSELDRGKGLHGEQTSGGVFKINNDNDASQLHAFPHGVVEHVSGKGDVTTQTKEGAMLNLKADGTVTNSNKNSSTTLFPDGGIETRNSAQGSSFLNKDGDWVIKSQNESAVRLGSGDALLEGPRGKLSSLVNNATKEISGKLGQGASSVRSIQNLIDKFEFDKNPETFLQSLSEEVGSIESVISSFPKVNAAIEQIKSGFSESQLGESLMSQADIFLDSEISKVIPKIKNIVAKGAKPTEILDYLARVLPDNLKQRIVPQQMLGVLNGLSHTPEMQEKYIVQVVTGQPYDAIKNLLNTGLHSFVGDAQKIINQAVTSIPDWLDESFLSSENLQAIADGKIKNVFTSVSGFSGIEVESADDFSLQQQLDKFTRSLRSRVGGFMKIIPGDLQNLFKNKDVYDLLQVALTGGNPVQALLGKSALKFADDFLPVLADGVGLGKAIEPVKKLLNIAGTGDINAALSLVKDIPEIGSIGNVTDIVKDIVPNVVTSVFKPFGGLFGNGKSKSNNFLGSLSNAAKGGVLRVTEGLVEASASRYLPSAKLVITGASASLRSATGLAEIYASGSHAGLSSAFGKFSFGAGGGSWISQGMMAMRIAQNIGKSAGVVLHPKSGASLASFHDSDFEDDANKWGNKSAEVSVDEGVVVIRTLVGDQHDIVVSPQGVFIEGYRVSEYFRNFEGRFLWLESNINQLLSGVTPAESQG